MGVVQAVVLIVVTIAIGLGALLGVVQLWRTGGGDESEVD